MSRGLFASLQGRRMRWLLSALALLLLAGLFRLWLGNDSPAASLNGSQHHEQTDSSAAAAKDAAIRTFGIIYPYAHPFYEMVTKQAQETAAKEKVKLLVKAPETANAEQQIRMMETMIKQHVDGIAIDPVDQDALRPIIDQAVEQGIPVICFESDSRKSKRLSYLGADNRLAGRMMGQLLDRLLHGTGMVLVESGLTGMSSQNERVEGLLEFLKESTGIQVLEVRNHEGREERALSDLEAMIELHPHFDALVDVDYISFSTSVLVWKAMGLKRFALSFGSMPDMEKALVNGQLTAALSQNEELWGKMLVERLLDAAEGNALPPNLDTGLRELTPNP